MVRGPPLHERARGSGRFPFGCWLRMEGKSLAEKGRPLPARGSSVGVVPAK